MITFGRPAILFVFVALVLSTLSCSRGQPATQEQSLRATIAALETQSITANDHQATPIPSSGQSAPKDQRLLATVAALQTQIAKPAATSLMPTITPIPSATLLPDTSPNTMLEVGDTWRQDGLELSLQDVFIDHVPTGPGCWSCGYPAPYFTLYLTNRKSQQISVRYNLVESISVTDNLGRRLPIAPPHLAVPNLTARDNFESKTVILNSGDKVALQSWGDYGPPSAIIMVDATDPAVTECIVTVSISSIKDARWRIPIAH